MAAYGSGGGCSFVMVGGEREMALTDLTVTGYDTTKGISSGFELQDLNDLGGTAATYQWHDFVKKSTKYYGWFWVQGNKYVKDMEEPVMIPAGKGLWVWTSEDGIGLKLQCSGQVLTEGMTVPFKNYGKMIANPYPVDVKINDLWATGYDTVKGISSGIEIQFLNDLGGTAATFQWHDFVKKSTKYYGWFWVQGNKYVKDATEEEQKAFVLGAGKAAWSFCEMEAPKQYYLNFPAILQDAPTTEE